MKKRVRSAIASLLIGLSPSLMNAQITSASSNLVAQPIPDRSVIYNYSGAGVSKPIIWGMDAGGWTSNLIWAQGARFLGAGNLKITRIPVFATDILYGDTLQQRQKDLVKDRLNQAGLAGHSLQIMLNHGGGEISWYSRDAVGHARYAQLMELTKNYIESFGHTVVSITGYNEPDYGWDGATMDDFKNFITACKQRPGLNGVRYCGGNTLNNDMALAWYNYVKPAGLTEGNTHQLAGSFDSFASFYQTVKANGDYATNDEVHDIVEGMVGAEYGVQAGIFWGYANLARGEFVKACNGVRLGYAEHRPNWTAASVYRKTDGQVQAFGGASERQAVTTTYRYVSKDKPVYYEGYGPQHEYMLEMPGGTGYMTNQPYAERVINIESDDDIQPVINGRCVVVNKNSGKVMEVAGSSTADGGNVQQNSYSGATSQQWDITPVSNRIGGDFSYFTLTNVNSGKVLDNAGFGFDNGANVQQWTNSTSGAQIWFFEYAGDGWFRIKNRHNALCVDVWGADIADGANICQWGENGANNQLWRLLPVGAPIEFAAPNAPTNPVATPRTESVLLTWTASSSTDVAGYTIFRAETSGGPYTTIARNVTTTSFVDNTATLTGQYFYKITAVDNSLNRSAFTSEVSATTTSANDLVASYQFEGNTQDNTINLNRCATYGGTSFVGGKTGQAIALNGTNAFVQLPATVANQQAITVATWVYWNGGNAWQRIFDFGNGENEYMYLTPSTASAGKMRFAITTGSWWSEQGLEVPVLPTDQWAHVAVTLDATGVSLYVNGALAGQSSSITLKPSDIKPVLNYIGRSQFADPLFNGNIDDFRVYNYAMSASEISNLVGPLSGRIYTVQSKLSGKVLDVYGSVNSSPVIQYDNWSGSNQKWLLQQGTDGYWSFAPQHVTGKVLDVPGCNFTNGVQLNIWDNYGNDCQKFQLVYMENGYYQIRVKNGTKALDVYGASLNNGASIVLWDCLAGDNQQWRFIESSSTLRSAGVLQADTFNGSISEFSVWPVPADDVLHITYPSARFNRERTFAVYDMNGRIMISKDVNTNTDTEVSVSNLPSGVYLLKLLDNEKVIIKKVVVRH